MGQSYPIWNDIEACIYKGSKSYGVRQTGKVSVYVGTSATNSHLFVNHRVTHRVDDKGLHTYRFYLNDKCVAKAEYNSKTEDYSGTQWIETL